MRRELYPSSVQSFKYFERPRKKVARRSPRKGSRDRLTEGVIKDEGTRDTRGTAVGDEQRKEGSFEFYCCGVTDSPRFQVPLKNPT